MIRPFFRLWMFITILGIVFMHWFVIRIMRRRNLNDYFQHVLLILFATEFLFTFPFHYVSSGNFLDDLWRGIYKTTVFCIKSLGGIALSDPSITDLLIYYADGIYNILLRLILLLIPIATTGLVVTFLGVTFYSIKYLAFSYGPVWKKEIYMISDLNDSTLLLAQSINKNQKRLKVFLGKEPRKIIFFCNVSKNNPLLEKCYSSFHFWQWGLTDKKMEDVFLPGNLFKGTHRHIFIITEQQEENEYSTLHRLNHKICDLANSHTKDLKSAKPLHGAFVQIILLQSSQAGDRFVDNERRFIYRTVQNGLPPKEQTIRANYTIQAVDRFRLLSYEFVYNNPFSHYTTANGKYRICKVLLLGSGSICKEFIKLLLWCNEFRNIKLSATVCDPYASSLKSNILLECPALTNEQLCSVINFQDVSLRGEEFEKKLQRYASGVNYIITACKDDRETMDTTMFLTSYYEKERLQGRGLVTENVLLGLYIENPDNQAIMKQVSASIKDHQDKNVGIPSLSFVGNPMLYSREALFGHELLKEAYHPYKPNTAFPFIQSAGQYAHHSALQKALSNKLRKSLWEKMDYKYEDFTSDTFLSSEAVSEHNRFCMYNKTEGFSSIESSKIEEYYDSEQKHLNRDSKQTPYLCSWEQLDTVDEAIYQAALKLDPNTPKRHSQEAVFDYISNICQSLMIENKKNQ